MHQGTSTITLPANLTSLSDPLLDEAYRQAAERNVLAALNPEIFFGYFAVCADGKGFGGNTTYPGLDWGQSAEALLWLGRTAEVLASWEYVMGFQREDGLFPFAIHPDTAGTTIPMGDRFTLTTAPNGGIFEHWVPGNPLRALPNVTVMQLAEAIFQRTQDTDWLIRQLPFLRRATDWLLTQITAEGLVHGAGFYVERPTRLEFDGVTQCLVADAFALGDNLFRTAGDAEYAEISADAAWRIISCFRTTFWAGDHCVEYMHPVHGAISHHGLTDVDWAAIATGVASEEQVAVLWPQLRDNEAFIYDDMPTGISTQPESYADWEMQGIDRHDLAAMGRVWYLESRARARMGDTDGLLRSLRRVAEKGRQHDWDWVERYFPAHAEGPGIYHIHHYCEYPANFIRIVNRFIR